MRLKDWAETSRMAATNLFKDLLPNNLASRLWCSFCSLHHSIHFKDWAETSRTAATNLSKDLQCIQPVGRVAVSVFVCVCVCVGFCLFVCLFCTNESTLRTRQRLQEWQKQSKYPRTDSPGQRMFRCHAVHFEDTIRHNSGWKGCSKPVNTARGALISASMVPRSSLKKKKKRPIKPKPIMAKTFVSQFSQNPQRLSRKQSLAADGGI